MVEGRDGDMEAMAEARNRGMKERERAEMPLTVSVQLPNGIAVSTTCVGAQLDDTIDRLFEIRAAWNERNGD